MISSRATLFSSTVNLLLAAAGLAVVLALGLTIQVFYRSWREKQPHVDVPIINLGPDRDFAVATKRYMTDFKGILQEGYDKFKDGIYQVWGIDGFLLIVSPRFVSELNAFGTDVLDVHSASQNRIVGEYEWMRIADSMLFHTTLVDLTRHINGLLPSLHREVDFALASEFPDCKEWTPVAAWPRLFRTMALIVSLMTVGPDLSRDEAWISTMIKFLDDLFAGGWELKSYPLSLRHIVARGLVPGIRRVWKHQAKAREILFPVMEARRAAQAHADAAGKKYDKPKDLLQWLMDNAAKSSPPRTDAFVAEMCLVIGFGALHASTISLANVIFDLAAMPEYADTIREEYVQARERQAGDNNQAVLFNEMTRLDSFMKESQRMNPVAMTTFSRRAVKDLVLSTGLKIPKGTHILVPAGEISKDPELYPEPFKFDGMRFHERRQAAGTGEAASKNQYTSTSPQQMHFGFGRQACPGRFFASASIKCIVVHMLETFDFKWPEGQARPVNAIKGSMGFPSETAEILFKRR